jgi:alpha-galactosidase/6-phospho-beta-glucosidase family protein
MCGVARYLAIWQSCATRTGSADGSIHTLNVPNRRALPAFAPERVVEMPARLERAGATPLVQDALPSEVMGLLH